MTIEEIKALFEAAYHTKRIMTPHRDSCDRPLARDVSHLIYSYKALPKLINELKKRTRSPWDDEDEDQLDRFAVRFVVDLTGTIWFAREGSTGLLVPDHAHMSHTCYSAGNIYFSQDYQSITKITNKSGHFKPDPDTLVWAIAALSSLDVSFAPSLSMVMHTKIDSIDIKLSAEALLSLMPAEPFPASKNDFVINVSFTDEVVSITNPDDNIDDIIKHKFYSNDPLVEADKDNESLSPFKKRRCESPVSSFSMFSSQATSSTASSSFLTQFSTP